MTAMFLKSVAALMLAVEIAIHVYLAPDHLHEVLYIGIGFLIASALCAVAIVLVLLERSTGWLLGAAVCAGMAGAFVVSRLFGLPDYHEAWTSDDALGLWSLPPEALFLVCATVRLRPRLVRSSLA
jgi:hypothetical protein